MSTNRKNLFVFIHTATNTVLHQKSSLEFDFTLESKDFTTIRIVSDHEIAATLPFSQNYWKSFGLHAQTPFTPELEGALAVVKRKIEILLLLKTSVLLIEKDIRLNFSDETLRLAPVTDEKFKIYWEFTRVEQDLLMSRTKKFFEDFQASLEHCATVSEVNKRYAWLVKNVNLGVYSATNRERKGIGFGESHKV